MSNAISKSERGGKTVYIEKVGVFYDQQSGEIHLSVPGTDWFITTVSNKPGSARVSTKTSTPSLPVR